MLDPVCPTYYYSLLLFHISTSDTAENTKRDYKELAEAVKNLGTEVAFSPILIVKEMERERTDRIKKISAPGSSAMNRASASYVLELALTNLVNLIQPDEVYLSEKGRSIFGNKLPSLVRRAFN